MEARVSGQVECMCLQCGSSLHVDRGDLVCVEIDPETGGTMADNLFCTACGGVLLLVGAAGEEPSYVNSKFEARNPKQ